MIRGRPRRAAATRLFSSISSGLSRARLSVQSLTHSLASIRLAASSSSYSKRNDTVPPSSNHALQEATSILNLEVSRAAEGAAHQKALLERNQALDQQRVLEKKVADLIKQLEQRNSSAPLSFERCDSAKDGFEVLQLGRGASDKEIVDKYDAMVRLWPFAARGPSATELGRRELISLPSRFPSDEVACSPRSYVEGSFHLDRHFEDQLGGLGSRPPSARRGGGSRSSALGRLVHARRCHQ